MRNYGVYYLGADGSLKSWACFSFMNSQSTYYRPTLKAIQEAYDGCVLISNYIEPETTEYVDLILGIINEIQPCKLVEREDETYISYKMIGLFYNDLLLLSFIRHLWYSPFSVSANPARFSKSFFEKLKEISEDKELSAMEKLLTANKFASGECQVKINEQHSNAHAADTLVIKKLPEDFYTKSIGFCRDFLTNK